MRVYIFHGHQFRAPVMRPLFYSHELYDDLTLDDVHPSFHPLMYPIDGESDSETRLTPTCFVESDPSKLSYPSRISLTSDSSSSAANQALPSGRGRGFIHT